MCLFQPFAALQIRSHGSELPYRLANFDTYHRQIAIALFTPA